MKSAVTLMPYLKRNEKPLALIAQYYVCDVPEGFTLQPVLVGDGRTDANVTPIARSHA